MHALKLYPKINMFMAMPSCMPLGTSPTAFPMSPWATLAREARKRNVATADVQVYILNHILHVYMDIGYNVY
jgi:hypothetical protein